MPRKCTVCAHKQRKKIEAVMLAPNVSLREISQRWGVSISAAHRHRDAHLPATALAKQVEQETARGQSLAETWMGLKQRLERLANDAQRAKDPKGEIAAIREQTRLVDLGIRAASELRKPDSATAPMHLHKDWPDLVAALAGALAQHPQALGAVRSAFDSVIAKGDV